MVQKSLDRFKSAVEGIKAKHAYKIKCLQNRLPIVTNVTYTRAVRAFSSVVSSVTPPTQDSRTCVCVCVRVCVCSTSGG
jgi:hypothetical protein